jgi:trk system potassium uptake protein TrkH
MNYLLTIRTIGIALMFVSLFMVLPIGVSLFYGGDDAYHLGVSFVLTLFTGMLLYASARKHKTGEVRHRDAFAIVTASWLTVTFFGALPFYHSGVFHSFTDAYFESMAGFTTTGASVLMDIESVPRGLLFWRSIIQWIGGMGIILFAVAILPMLGTGGMQLFKAEVPEISVDKLKPRIIDTAKALWSIYVGFTSVAAACYLAEGMDFFDALCHAFTTMATGGFSTKNGSMAHFESPAIELTASLFMFLAGVNYSLHFYLFRGKLSKLWKSSELKFYLGVTIAATTVIAFDILGSNYGSVGESLRLSLFQVISLMTTTGYATADFELWPAFSQMLLMIFMFFGGMIGSTGGGIKQVRILLMLKQGYRELYQLIHPRAVTAVKLDDKFLTKEVLGSIWGFLFLFVIICVGASVAMAATGQDIITSATTVISAMCNVGPALGSAGPSENYASIPVAGKWILIFCMLTGRLEVYTVIILFLPNFWKK